MSSTNDAYAKFIINKLNDVPKQAIVRASKKVFRTLIQLTKQDSGQAAFNWKYSINSSDTSEPFLYVKDMGRHPDVGRSREYRSLTGRTFVVARQKIRDFEQDITNTTKVVNVLFYNPITDLDYQDHAGLAGVNAIVSNPGILAEEVKLALREAGF